MGADGNNTFKYFGTQGDTGVKFDKNNFRIDGGVRELPANRGYYVYTHTSHEYIGGIEIVFFSEQVPKIGDQVVNGTLVPRQTVPNPARDVFQEGWPKPIINNDPGFQVKSKRRDTWPRDREDT